MSSEAMEDIKCEVSSLDWIHEYVDSDANLIPETEVHHIYQNIMFLTKVEAKTAHKTKSLPLYEKGSYVRYDSLESTKS